MDSIRFGMWWLQRQYHWLEPVVAMALVAGVLWLLAGAVRELIRAFRYARRVAVLREMVTATRLGPDGWPENS